jgi:hypothetical protein
MDWTPDSWRCVPGQANPLRYEHVGSMRPRVSRWELNRDRGTPVISRTPDETTPLAEKEDRSSLMPCQESGTAYAWPGRTEGGE